MQFIRDLYAAKRAAGRPVIYFEFFPPKTGKGDRNLLEKQIPALLAGQARLLLRHLRRRRQHARQNVDDCGSHPAAARPARRWRISPVSATPASRCASCWKKSARWAAKTFSRCAAIRPAAANFSRRPAVLNSPRNSSGSSASRAIFPSASPVFPKATSRARKANTPTGGI